MKPLPSHPLSRCLKCNDWSPKSGSHKGSKRSSQRMTGQPNIGIRVEIGDIVVEILPSTENTRRQIDQWCLPGRSGRINHRPSENPQHNPRHNDSFL